MKNYHLTPSGDRWQLAEEGGGPVATFQNKAEALEGSARVVSRETGSLKIHKSDGTIEEERTYPRSADPAKSPG
ncbi:MAG TPA: DUF2188 domain-containing protein [Verrucomicrobiales bacterium]|nr:DUF2188 domain-containing protein [Verrucomicrobiales bacterium]